MGEKQVSRKLELVIFRMPRQLANHCVLDFLHGLGNKLKSKRHSFAKSPVRDTSHEHGSEQTTPGTILLEQRGNDTLIAHTFPKA